MGVVAPGEKKYRSTNAAQTHLSSKDGRWVHQRHSITQPKNSINMPVQGFDARPEERIS